MATHSLKKGRFTITRADTDDKIDLTISTSPSTTAPNTAYSHQKSPCDCKRDAKRHWTSIDTYSSPKTLNSFRRNIPSEKNLLDIDNTEPMISSRLPERDAKLSTDQRRENEMLDIVEGHMCKMFSDMLHIHRDLMIQILDKDRNNTTMVDSMFKTLEDLARHNMMLEIQNKQLMNRLGM